MLIIESINNLKHEIKYNVILLQLNAKHAVMVVVDGST